ncbi:MAG: AAA family ATPase [Lentisphaerae bacterium]|nr:AAA family ATPase [Lentisphaerota bacterium]MCP4103147.1 AAA family ATPase [Lentisphaerota bacterium]
MIIKAIFIDNYGSLSDRKSNGLGKGINVLYGPNEHGKTTLFEFVRRILFGFPPKKKNFNRFEPVNGNAPGGRLECVLDNGEDVIIERKNWRKGGDVLITWHDGRTSKNPEDLKTILRAGEIFYRNVFAVSIEELYSVDSLSDDDIKSRIYGAGMDIDGVSLAVIKKRFAASADDIFKPRGQNQIFASLKKQLSDLNSKITEAGSSIDQYEELIGQQEAVSAELNKLREQDKKLGNQLRGYERKRDASGEYLKFKTCQGQLKNFPDTPEVGDSELEELRELKTRLDLSENKLADHKVECEKLNLEYEEIVINNELLANASEVIALQGSIERYRMETGAIKAREKSIERLNSDIMFAKEEVTGIALNGINSPLTLKQQSDLEVFRQRFDIQRQEEIASQNLEQVLQQQSKMRFDNKVLKKICLAAAIISLIAGGVFLEIGMKNNAYALWVITFISIIAVLMCNKGHENDVDAKEEDNQLEKDWADWLDSASLSRKMQPDTVLKYSEKCQNLSKLETEKQGLEKEVEVANGWQEGIKQRVRVISAMIPSVLPSGDIPADINVIASAARANEALNTEKNSLNKRCSETKNNVVELQKRYAAASKTYSEYLKKYNLDSFLSFKEAHNLSKKRESLKDAQSRHFERLCEIFCEELDTNKLNNLLNDLSLDVLEEQIAEVKSDKNQLGQKIDELNAKRGSIENELQNITSDDQLIQLRNERERVIQQVRDAAGEWAVYVTANTILNKSIARYEREKQPEVLRQASEIFKNFTSGRYIGISKPLESDELQILTSNKTMMNVTQLSRGTREQLYLAMRLGLIEQYEQQTEALPVVFDDILVNFDQQRLQTAVKTLNKFAEKRQVIMLTCHKFVRDILLKNGASEVSF